ncbi:diguanylate phosphodiesterase [Tamilnaduibacter salinus]|uniref:Diguanylate phosphodiesterase n=2 Tax=Tamilnaduibacter salinus TaxID=1484056 RepID=A0A2A2I6X6_9GAMM|nr:diguanylate phosphodiesterase [Tamilnaduibacter salinus]
MGTHTTESLLRINETTIQSRYQPIFSPTHQRLVGYEALLRAHRHGAPVSPAAVLERAHANGRMALLDRELHTLHLSGFSQQAGPVWLFLNISPATCVDSEGALDNLERNCRLFGMNPAQVVLEVVETALDNQAALIRFVTRARTRGFQVAIDDFGTGDSNFERMWRLDPLIIKIDRTLLTNATQHPRARQLLNGLVSMIREGGSLVLLEGIETAEEARVALSTEADLLQGFRFGHPASLDDPSPVREMAFADQLAAFQHERHQVNATHDSYLRLLNRELVQACESLKRGQSLEAACGRMLTLAGIRRCFILNDEGIQIGGVISDTSEGTRGADFNPLHQSGGACWSHRDYFRRALEHPDRVCASRPYVGLPDAVRTVTFATRIPAGPVFCVDMHPDEVFEGQLNLPDLLPPAWD